MMRWFNTSSIKKCCLHGEFTFPAVYIHVAMSVYTYFMIVYMSRVYSGASCVIWTPWDHCPHYKVYCSMY